MKYQDIDAVIADYFLPDMDGMELLEQVAADQPGTARPLMAALADEKPRSEISKNIY